MIAVTLNSFDVAPGLREDLPAPEVAADQVLVRVRASSVNPVDVFIAAGALKGMAEYEFPVVSSVGAAGDGPGRTNAMAVPSPENLVRLAGLLDNATVAVPIQATYPLEQAVEALNTFPTQHTQGKLAISLP